MRLTDKNRSSLREACPIATLSTTNPTWTGLGLYLDLDIKRLMINHMHHGIAFKSFSVYDHLQSSQHGHNTIYMNLMNQ
jgi:hypothetical protein